MTITMIRGDRDRIESIRNGKPRNLVLVSLKGKKIPSSPKHLTGYGVPLLCSYCKGSGDFFPRA
jgi:hypothetical protein